jgi:hypothetical protein
MRYIVFTVDYEIFGNGTGDVRQHVTEPAEHMARTLANRGVPLTVFVEMEEQVAFEQNAVELRQHYGYDPGSLICHQVRELARDGHDFQLHLHPQWHGCRWTSNGWALNHEKLTVDSLFDDQESANDYMAERAARLEGMVSQPRYRVSSYRAGGFAAQPGRRLLHALAANDFVTESSVVCGLHREERFVGYDYRSAPRAHRCWRVREDVATPDADGAITEIPVHSVMGRRFHQLTWKRLHAKFARHVPRQRQDEMMNQFGISKRRPLGLLKFLWQPVPLKLDFHNVGPHQLLRWILSAPPPHPTDPLDVLVLIGHTKEHVDRKGFEKFVSLVTSESGLRIISLSEVARLLNDRSGTGRAPQQSPAVAARFAGPVN